MTGLITKALERGKELGKQEERARVLKILDGYWKDEFGKDFPYSWASLRKEIEEEKE